jgi:hypothetical protein
MHKDRHIRIRAERRAVPDVRRLSRALIALAMAQAKAEQEAQDEDRPEGGKRDKGSPRRPA